MTFGEGLTRTVRAGRYPYAVPAESSGLPTVQAEGRSPTMLARSITRTSGQ